MPVWLQAFNEGARGTDWGGVMAGLDADGAARRDLLPHRPAQGHGGPDRRRGQGVARWRSIVGVDVGGTTTRAVCFDGDAARRCAAPSAPTPRGAADDRRRSSPASSATSPARPSAVAIGDARAGRRRRAASSARPSTSASPGRRRSARSSRARVGVPVHLENDVNAAALGAFAHLGLAPTQSLAYVNVGTGIAAGFVLAGRLWRGRDRRRRRDRARADAVARAGLPVRPGRVRRGGRVGPRRGRRAGPPRRRRGGHGVGGTTVRHDDRCRRRRRRRGDDASGRRSCRRSSPCSTAERGDVADAGRPRPRRPGGAGAGRRPAGQPRRRARHAPAGATWWSA